MAISRLSLRDRISKNLLIVILIAAIIGMFVLGEIVAEGFLKTSHIFSVLRTASFLGICGIGQTLTILTGGIDLSIGDLISMGNVFSCIYIAGINANTWWVMGSLIIIGFIFGSISGGGVVYLRISPLVMTLAVGAVVKGLTFIISKGTPKGCSSPILQYLAVGNVAGFFPMVAVIWIVLTAVFIIVLRSTVFGKKVYYIGSNETVSFLSGVDNNRMKILVYAISGAMSAFTGSLMAGYTQQAFLSIGKEYTLWSITAVVIGGTALTGGKGGCLGTYLGSIILILIEGLLTVLHISEAGRRIINGVIVLVLVSVYFRKKS